MPGGGSEIVAAVVAIGKYVAGSFAAFSAGTATAAQIATVVGVQVGMSATALAVANAIYSPNVSNGGSSGEWRANPDEPLFFVAGRRARAGEIAYAPEYGADNRYDGWVTTWSAGGPIDGFEQFYADQVPVQFGANGAATTGGNYVNNMWLQTRLGHQPDTALTSPSGLDGGAVIPGWGPNHRLSGYACWMWTLRQDSKNATYPAGTPAPLMVGRGMLAYDWRKDSTFPGGSGPQRLWDRSTWAYTVNPIVRAANYQLGHFHGDRLVGGCGMSPDALHWPSLTEAANVCDENNWQCHAIYHSMEDKTEVYAALLQAGGAKVAKYGGRVGCIARGFVRTPVMTITPADTAGDIEIDAASSMLDRINAITARCVQEAQNWAMVPVTTISVAAWEAEDGGARRHEEVSYPYVVHAQQAGELALLDAADSREGITGVWPLRGYCAKITPGAAFIIEAPGYQLDGLKAVCIDRDYDPASNTVFISFRSETDAKVTFALGHTTTPPAAPALTGSSPYDVPTPREEDWTGIGTVIGGDGGTQVPSIDLEGLIDAVNVRGVWIEYRALDIASWTTWYKGEPSEADYQITGLAPGRAYLVSVRYQNEHGVWGGEDQRLILGPYTVGELVASDSLNFGGLSLSELFDQIDADFEAGIADLNVAVAAVEADVAEQRRALGANIRGVLARLGGVRSGLLAEVTERRTEMAVEVERIDALIARADDLEDGQAQVEAAVIALDSAKADLAALEAVADSLDVVIARVSAVEDEFEPVGRVGEAEATIAQQSTAIANLGDDLSAAASLLSDLDAQINDGSASLSAQVTEAQQAIASLGDDLGSLASVTLALAAEFEAGGRVPAAEAAIIANQQAVADAARAEARALRRLRAQRLGNSARLTAESLVRTDETSALAQELLEVLAEIEGEAGVSPGLAALVAVLAQAFVDTSDPGNPVARALFQVILDAGGGQPGIMSLRDSSGGSEMVLAFTRFLLAGYTSGDQIREIMRADATLTRFSTPVWVGNRIELDPINQRVSVWNNALTIRAAEFGLDENGDPNFILRDPVSGVQWWNSLQGGLLPAALPPDAIVNSGLISAASSNLPGSWTTLGTTTLFGAPAAGIIRASGMLNANPTVDDIGDPPGLITVEWRIVLTAPGQSSFTLATGTSGPSGLIVVMINRPANMTYGGNITASFDARVIANTESRVVVAGVDVEISRSGGSS